MAQKKHPVCYARDSLKKLQDLFGDNFVETDLAIQMLLSRQPDYGPLLNGNTQSIKMTTPLGHIAIPYEFDGEHVYILDVVLLSPPLSSKSE